MIKLVKFDPQGSQVYQYPDNSIATTERIKQEFPATEYFPHVLELSSDVCQAVMNLNALRQMHNIDSELSEEDAIQAIEEIINAPQPEPEPTAEERIASALEFQAMMVIPMEGDE